MLKRIFFLSGIILFSGIVMNNAYAYIDPGTSSMLLQVIVGALVGVGITIKVYWEKIKFRIISRTKK
ncbi:MAG: hypothetical protein CL905_03495 [Dehalococcoidia bacterium]|nr:hypothetical protein [Dehalococcoidia bacterium]|tara:strand:+ start:5955 stop:6155 length:201 start_codon:yes stop_codon:yes gene_type:complete